MNVIQPEIDWDHEATPGLELYKKMQAEDPLLFWRVGCGHHENLFEDATSRIEDALVLHEEHCYTCGVDHCKTRKILMGEL